MNILAFESSCDETAVAVVEDGRRVLSDAIASQADMHALYGGVVPEIASRKHVEAIAALTDKALARTCHSTPTPPATLTTRWSPTVRRCATYSPEMNKSRRPVKVCGFPF